ncbi:MAG: hypothetical protein JXP34_05720 [Planctomycetes bacterium]|nr:hypothetical protein [Planctomycetota bacterium]
MAFGSATSARWRRWLAVVAVGLTSAFFIVTWQFYGNPFSLLMPSETWRVVVCFEDEEDRVRLEDRISSVCEEIPFSESRRSGAMVVLIPAGEEEAHALETRIRDIGDPGITEVRAYLGRR